MIEQLSTILFHWLVATWSTAAAMSPYLLLGFLIAGLLSVVVSQVWVERHLGGRGLWPVVKASIIGVPLPLCSCGVIPVAASLRQHGAGRGATTSFLLSTPQTGVDSIFATYALLGPVFAVVRPVVALISGVIGGGLVDLLDPATRPGDRSPPHRGNPPQNPGTPADFIPPPGNIAAPPSSSAGACCGSKSCHSPEPTHRPAHQPPRWTRALRYGLLTLPNDIARSLILGILLAGAISAVARPDLLKPWLGGGILSMLLMMLVGLPLYVCSTGSIPLALSFLHLGVSPGAALVFLITGPATNAATISVNWKVLGPRTTVIYLATVVLTALAAGLVLDATAATLGSLAIPHHPLDHAAGLTPADHLWAGTLLAVLLAAMIAARLPARTAPAAQARPTRSTTRDPDPLADRPLTLRIEGMTCSHCVSAVSRALREQPGVRTAQVDLPTGNAVVTGSALDPDGMIAAVRALGYQARTAGSPRRHASPHENPLP